MNLEQFKPYIKKIKPLSEKQKIVLSKILFWKEKFIWFYGGVRSWKTFVIILGIILLSLIYKNLKWLIVRNTFVDLKNTTLETFLEVLDMLWLKENIHYIYNKSDKFIEFKQTKSVIKFMPAEKPRRFKGLEIDIAFLDEANEIPFYVFKLIINRLSWKTLKNKKIILAQNTDTWKDLYYDFFINKKDESKFVIRWTTLDNLQNLPDDYLETLYNIYDEETFRIYVLGERNKKNEQVFNNFNKVIHTYDYDIIWYDNIFFWLDFWINDLTTIVCIKEKDGVYYVDDSYWINGDPTEILEWIYNFYKKYIEEEKIKIWTINFSEKYKPIVYADPTIWNKWHLSGQTIADFFINKGINITPAKKTTNLLQQINLIKFMFKPEKEKNKLFIKNTNIYLIEELENLLWKKDKFWNILDEPNFNRIVLSNWKKSHYDFLSALRYALYSDYIQTNILLEKQKKKNDFEKTLISF